MTYTPPKSVTVTLPYDEYSEVCDTLQLIAVLGIDLFVRGRQPDKKKLLDAFTRLAGAEMPPPPDEPRAGYYWAREPNEDCWFVVFVVGTHVSEIASSTPRAADELVFGPPIPEYTGG